MAKAGARYEVETGNIWGYAHRGDLTGVRAALERGVQPNLLNVAGWSACHAAAAAGHTKVIVPTNTTTTTTTLLPLTTKPHFM